MTPLEMGTGGYGYADGTMSEEERVEAQKEALARRMGTLERHCYEKLHISLREAASDAAYQKYYSNNGISRRKGDVKEFHDEKFSAAIRELKDFIDAFIRNPDLLDEIMEDEEDTPDLRPIMVQKIKETDDYLEKEKELTAVLLQVEGEVLKDIVKRIIAAKFKSGDIVSVSGTVPGWFKVKTEAIEEDYEVGSKIRTGMGVLEITDILTRYFGESTVSFK